MILSALSSLPAILSCFCVFRHFGPDYFCDYYAKKNYVCMGIDRYECVFTDNAKIAEPLEITAIRCNKRTPEISLCSLSSGGDGGSRTHVQECFRKTFSERSRLFFYSLAPRQAASLGFRYPVDTLTLPGDHARGPCIHDAGFPGCR